MQLSEWFEALNTDFRYQLTCVGRFASAIIESEVAGNRFTIRANLAQVKVSWQVAAGRNDAWMQAHPFVVERRHGARRSKRHQHPPTRCQARG